MPFLSRDPRIGGPLVPRVTRVRRVFARVGASAVHAIARPCLAANPRGGGRIVAGGVGILNQYPRTRMPRPEHLN